MHAPLAACPRAFAWLLTACLMLAAMAPRASSASPLTYTLSASAGFGYEVAPTRNVQAENLLVTFGLGILADILRFELGVLGAFGTIKSDVRRTGRLELRPMLRAQLPIIPIYARAVFVGLSPFAADRNLAYGGALGLLIPLSRLGLFVEAGTLPRRAEGQTHWILEARAGASFRL